MDPMIYFLFVLMIPVFSLIWFAWKKIGNPTPKNK